MQFKASHIHIPFFILAFIAIAYVSFVDLRAPQKAQALEAGWNISAPSSVSLPAVNWSLASQTAEVTFGTNVNITNDSSTTQGFTAQVTSTELIHSVDPALFMGYANLQIKTGALISTQTAGVTTPINGLYTAFSGSLATSDPINFMIADARSRDPGSWAATPSLLLTIPAKQRSGTYNATLTFSVV